MRIVLNADDFGMSDDTVRGTIECFERGSITSATIMPTMPATQKAIEYARAHPQFSFGVHLTFAADSCEKPVSPRQKIPDLVAENGLFPPSSEVRSRARFGQLPVEQIVMEIEAQVGLLRDRGIAVTHVDSHAHLHKLGPFRAALREVLPRLGIERVRNVQDVYLRTPLRHASYWVDRWRRRQIMRAFRTTDHFYIPASSFERDWQSRLLKRFDPADDGSMEISVHPGYVDFWRSDERAGAKRLAEQARTLGHRIVDGRTSK